MQLNVLFLYVSLATDFPSQILSRMMLAVEFCEMLSSGLKSFTRNRPYLGLAGHGVFWIRSAGKIRAKSSYRTVCTVFYGHLISS